MPFPKMVPIVIPVAMPVGGVTFKDMVASIALAVSAVKTFLASRESIGRMIVDSVKVILAPIADETGRIENMGVGGTAEMITRLQARRALAAVG